MAPIKQTLKENKTVSGILIALFGLLMTWGIWVTNGIYAKQTAMQLDRGSVQSIIETQSRTLQIACNDIDELKTEDKNLRELIHQNHKEIMRLLIDIEKKVR